MSDYKKLVEELKSMGRACYDCQYYGLDCMRENEVCILADAAAAIEALEAEVKRLKDCNDELREKQTYIDHYGDKWLTSAKDVPTSAYNHGYMDGKNEAEQALEQKRERGEWKTDPHGIRWCSLCDSYYQDVGYGFNYCPNCGAKMEVQE